MDYATSSAAGSALDVTLALPSPLAVEPRFDWAWLTTSLRWREGSPLAGGKAGRSGRCRPSRRFSGLLSGCLSQLGQCRLRGCFSAVFWGWSSALLSVRLSELGLIAGTLGLALLPPAPGLAQQPGVPSSPGLVRGAEASELHDPTPRASGPLAEGREDRLGVWFTTVDSQVLRDPEAAAQALAELSRAGFSRVALPLYTGCFVTWELAPEANRLGLRLDPELPDPWHMRTRWSSWASGGWYGWAGWNSA